MGAKTDTYKVLIAKPEGKTPLVIPRYRCEDNNTKPDLRDI
jgi:hypothetical protein